MPRCAISLLDCMLMMRPSFRYQREKKLDVWDSIIPCGFSWRWWCWSIERKRTSDKIFHRVTLSLSLFLFPFYFISLPSSQISSLSLSLSHLRSVVAAQSSGRGRGRDCWRWPIRLAWFEFHLLIETHKMRLAGLSWDRKAPHVSTT